MTTNDTIIKALRLALEDAYKKREAAAHGGEWTDGGAGHLRELVAEYNAGRNGTVPNFLKPYIEKANVQADPEYAEYERLKKKFSSGAAGL